MQFTFTMSKIMQIVKLENFSYNATHAQTVGLPSTGNITVIHIIYLLYLCIKFYVMLIIILRRTTC